MKLTVNFKEVNYGWLEIEVPDNATDEEIMEKAWDEFWRGGLQWGKTNTDITNWEEA